MPLDRNPLQSNNPTAQLGTPTDQRASDQRRGAQSHQDPFHFTTTLSSRTSLTFCAVVDADLSTSVRRSPVNTTGCTSWIRSLDPPIMSAVAAAAAAFPFCALPVLAAGDVVALAKGDFDLVADGAFDFARGVVLDLGVEVDLALAGGDDVALRPGDAFAWANGDPFALPAGDALATALALGVATFLGVGTFFVDPPLDFRLSIAGPRGVLAASGVDLNGPSGFLVSFLIHAPPL
eukprot:m.142477 g.142477  ORF g.142477 m.142477 type:complete len:235 (+) comp14069_c1_seq3:838-1542(+)